MNISCGHCKGRHASVAAVRDCSVFAQAKKDLAASFVPVVVAERPALFEPTPVGSHIAVANASPAYYRPTLPDVSAGYYAVASRTGNNDLDFFRVDRPTEGRWAGRTFVKRVIGGQADAPVRGDQARAALDAILAAGERESAQRYGQEIGRCGRCNRHLTDETSRAYGLGPDCRNKD